MQDAYISISVIQEPVRGGAQGEWLATFLGTSTSTTGVKPTWTVSGAASTFIYSDSTQTKVLISIPLTPPSGQIQLTATAVIPETPAITITESRCIVI